MKKTDSVLPSEFYLILSFLLISFFISCSFQNIKRITTTSMKNIRYQTSYGFTIEMGAHWFGITKKELQDNPEKFDLNKIDFNNSYEVNKNEVIDFIRAGEFEMFFKQVPKNAIYKPAIDIREDFKSIPENEEELSIFCKSMPTQYSFFYGEKINFYQCKLKEVNGVKSLFIEADGGIVKDSKTIHYILQKAEKKQILITLTVNKNDISLLRDEFDKIVYSIKMDKP